MEQNLIDCERTFKELFEEKQRAIGDFAKEVAEREWELMEFNLFVSSSGKKHLDEATNSVKKLRKMESEGKINLEQFENLAEEF
jgi:hypothetical protein